MEITFKSLKFAVNDIGQIGLVEFFGYKNDYNDKSLYQFAFPEFDVAGGNLSGCFGQSKSHNTRALRYVGHSIEGDTLTIVQKNDLFEVTSFFTGYGDTNAIRVTQNFKNISDEEQMLITANTIGLRFGKGGVPAEHKDWYFHRFSNARYHESSPNVRSFYDMGFLRNNGYFSMVNNGNVSSLYNVPQGIVENRKSSDFFMFQIESYTSWFAELSVSGMYNLQLGGPNDWHNLWTKTLAVGESYLSTPVALCHGTSLNDVVANMTWYRRHIKPDCAADRKLPSIYNEYMHFSWDDPYQQRAMDMAPVIAKTGCEYYVIDCGWHDSRDYDTTGEMYKHFGTWYEDRGRFPDGIKAVADKMHEHGMKFGLWIGPEVVGCKNEKMLSYYDDDCFITKNGKKVFNGTGYLINYANPKVREYMTATMDRMINEYGCDYIKFDGCPNPGLTGRQLYDYMDAFTEWSYEMTKRHPNVIFEDCAGGGLRTDYKALSIFSLISTSDQTDYLDYPYITGNIMISVLPEQAAVWSYPVDDKIGKAENADEVNKIVTKERVVINMMNAVLGRIHLASRLHLLDDEKQALVKEGIDFYNSITPDKLKSVPYLPKGYAMYGDTLVSVGLKTDKKVYLGVWNLGGDRHVELNLPDIVAKSANVCYPKSLDTNFELKNNKLVIDFTENEQGRIFEIEL